MNIRNGAGGRDVDPPVVAVPVEATAPPMVTLPASVIAMLAAPAAMPVVEVPKVAPVVLKASWVMLPAPPSVSVAVLPEMVQPVIDPAIPWLSVIV